MINYKVNTICLQWRDEIRNFLLYYFSETKGKSLFENNANSKNINAIIQTFFFIHP